MNNCEKYIVHEEGSNQRVAAGAESRSFSRGVGFLLQAYGAALLLVMTCTCAGFAFFEAGRWQTSGDALVLNQSVEEQAMEGENAKIDVDQNEERMANMALLLGSAVGAFCLIGFGVGMQADRGLFPAVGATVTGLVMMGAYGWSVAVLYGLESPWWNVLFGVILGVLSLGVFVMSFISCVEVMRYPVGVSGPPTVPGDVFPDPWAKGKSADSSYDQPIRESIEGERARLKKQLDELDELEERLGGG